MAFVAKFLGNFWRKPGEFDKVCDKAHQAPGGDGRSKVMADQRPLVSRVTSRSLYPSKFFHYSYKTDNIFYFYSKLTRSVQFSAYQNLLLHWPKSHCRDFSGFVGICRDLSEPPPIVVKISLSGFVGICRNPHL